MSQPPRSSTGPIRRTSRKLWPVLRDYIVISVGVVILALGIDLFLAPNDVVTGGASGVAIILNRLLATPIGPVVLAINVPLFVVGLRYLGGLSFAARTIYAVFFFSAIVDQIPLVLDNFPTLKAGLAVKEPLLYILYGGILNGLGTGLVFRARGTTGGSDIGARLLNRFARMSMGNAFLVLDAVVFVVAGFYFGLANVLYALTVSFISSRVVDFVQEGLSYTRQLIIITNRMEEVSGEIMRQTGHGVTILEGTGAYTMQQRPVLLTVVLPSELSVVRSIIEEADPAAFVIVSQAQEVLGQGFRPLQPPTPPASPLPRKPGKRR